MKTLPRGVILTGDARTVLTGLLAESVDCIVTSPPYAGGLRDYGLPGQIGQEQTVADYVENLRAVLREAHRVLKPTGSLWLNVGDSYAHHPAQGVPRKSLLLAPERLAATLVADGWILRNKVVWAKTNPLPQSAADRLSPTYEFLYFFTKRPRYFFDLDAVRIPHTSGTPARASEVGRRYQGGNSGLGALKAAGRVGHPAGKNPGDVWLLPTAVDRAGHQATFPQALIERPIAATCPERICVECDRAWTRPVRTFTVHTNEGARTVRKVGELARCDCFAPTRPGVVCDLFAGTGTTLAVAERLGRDWLGIELNPAYAEIARARVNEAARRAA